MKLLIFSLLLLTELCTGQYPRDCTNNPINKEHELAVRDQHNFYRARHQAPPLILNEQLSLSAQQCAEYYVNMGLIDSSCGYKNGAGENQYATWYTSSQPSCSALGNSATTYWYNAVQYYDYRTPGYSTKTGSFTQLVWLNSKFFGVGCATKNGFAVITTLYSPTGNMLTHGADPNSLFRTNVLPPAKRNGFSRAMQLSSFTYAHV